MARLATKAFVLPEPDFTLRFPNKGPDEVEFDKLQDASNALPEGEIVGGLLRWQRGDGYAYYLVTKAQPLTLQHVPFMDAWTIDAATIRGLRKQDVLDQLDRHRRLAALFESKSKTGTA